MKIIVTGAQGQLGKEIVDLFQQKGFQVYGFGKKQLDITNLDQVRSTITTIRPDMIIHSAAYTAVDTAEFYEDKAYLVNAIGTRNVAMAAQAVGAKLCYISTDYVFDGSALIPYNEYDNTNPINVYGKLKLAGERFVQDLSLKHFIVRTSWLYGNHGSNFVKTMLKLATDKSTLKVVNDQIGSPTYAVDLAKFLFELIVTDKYGIYHASNTGFCSWYEFAKAIFEVANIQIQVEPCTTDEYPRPAPRPKYSVMDHHAIRVNGFQDLRHWRNALRDFIHCLYKSNEIFK